MTSNKRWNLFLPHIPTLLVEQAHNCIHRGCIELGLLMLTPEQRPNLLATHHAQIAASLPFNEPTGQSQNRLR